MAEEAVKVAVRVRPFNAREEKQGAKCIIEMSKQSTTITNPNNNAETKSFNFDHSYWSHDGEQVDENGFFNPKSDSNYIGQNEVFQDIGVGILENAWQGYNTSLFAYGQTGSGKSYSVVGYGQNKGIVPRFCEEIFEGIKKKKSEGSKALYEVVFSMLEIYNECVRDLLDVKDKVLKVRQHPKKGFYADGLITIPVKDFDDIERRIEQGTKNRTIASTNMNATSSRAHTIVGVTFIQKALNASGKETAKSSLVNLVDLAGSERVTSTGATGDRLKEGAAINQSLSNLGNCISALSERAEGKNVRVPFRDSTLTKLLKNALGGNSKTIMIAALSPADINYEETLSTLRYADRAKQIKTKATVNEDPTEKLIKDLQEENEKLKQMMLAGQIETIAPPEDDVDFDDKEETQGLSEEEIKAQLQEEFEARMAENERMLAEMQRKWEEKLADADRENREKDEQERLAHEERKTTPHLYNLSPDAMLNGMVVYLLKKEVNTIGRRDEDPTPAIPLMGINIMAGHGEIRNQDGGFTVCNHGDSRILVNGVSVNGDMELHHNDRVLIGTGHMYVFFNPAELEDTQTEGSTSKTPTYEDALEEIALYSGIATETEDSPETVSTEISDFLPHLSEANGISEELDKKVQFEPVILTREVKELIGSSDEIICKVTQLETGYVWYWQKEKLINRKYAMEEMYRKFQNKLDWNLPPDQDPFFEPSWTECLIGITQIYIQQLAYMVNITSKWPLIDCRGLRVGELEVSILPCSADGVQLNKEGEDCFLDAKEDLTGKRVDFKIVISRGTLPKRYTEVFCKYKIFSYEDVVTDCIKQSKDVTFNHTQHITIENCDKDNLDFIMNKPLIIKVRGRQKAGMSKPINNAAKLGQTTRQIRKIEQLLGRRTSSKPKVQRDAFKTLAEYLLMKKRREMLEKKLLRIKELCEVEESLGEEKVSIAEVRKLLGFTQHLGTKVNTQPYLLPTGTTSAPTSSASSASSLERSMNKSKSSEGKKKSVTSPRSITEVPKGNEEVPTSDVEVNPGPTTIYDAPTATVAVDEVVAPTASGNDIVAPAASGNDIVAPAASGNDIVAPTASGNDIVAPAASGNEVVAPTATAAASEPVAKPATPPSTTDNKKQGSNSSICSLI